MVRTGGDLDYDVDFAVFVVARVQDFIKVCDFNSLFIIYIIAQKSEKSALGLNYFG